MRAEHTEDSSPQKSDFPKNFCLRCFVIHIKASENCIVKAMAVEQYNFTGQIIMLR